MSSTARARRRRSPARRRRPRAPCGSTISRRPTCDMPMPGDGDLVLELVARLRHRARVVRSSGRRRGTGPCRSRRWARTAGPTRPRRARSAPAPSCRRTRRRARTLTRLVVRRTRSSSSMATIAITYGGGKLGIHICSLTVKPATTRAARHLRRRPLVRAAVRAHRARRVAQLAAVASSAGSGASRPRPTSRRTSLGSVSSGSRRRTLRSRSLLGSAETGRYLGPCRTHYFRGARNRSAT